MLNDDKACQTKESKGGLAGQSSGRSVPFYIYWSERASDKNGIWAKTWMTW